MGRSRVSGWIDSRRRQNPVPGAAYCRTEFQTTFWSLKPAAEGKKLHIVLHFSVVATFLTSMRGEMAKRNRNIISCPPRNHAMSPILFFLASEVVGVSFFCLLVLYSLATDADCITLTITWSCGSAQKNASVLSRAINITTEHRCRCIVQCMQPFYLLHNTHV